jgi:hypothetical protein
LGVPETLFRLLPFTGLNFDEFTVDKVTGGEQAKSARD